ncbi:MAG: nitrite reductase large subunit NirB [Gammaproteobacteria bacterium]
MSRRRVVVIGNGMVGQKFLEAVAATGQDLSITVLGEEPRAAYDRVHLSEYFTGRAADDLLLAPAGFYAQHGIDLRLGVRATAIDRAAKTVSASDGSVLPYDELVLATGSYPFVPPVPGHDRAHVHVYRTIEDLDAIRTSAAQARNGVVIGGGLLGLEAAKALRDLGLETHVVEFAPRLMAVQIDDGGGTMLRRKIEALGVLVHTGRNTQAIVDGEGARHRLQFADGTVLDCDMLVFSAGIRPQDALARSAGLEIGPRGGIVVDDACRTSDPSVYAIGECALWSGRIYGLVAPGYEMAKVAAQQLLALPDAALFQGADMSTKLKLMGVDVASIGDAHAQAKGAKSYAWIDEPNGIYKKIVVSEDNKRLLGAVLVGEASDYGSLLQIMLNGVTLPAQPESMILPATDGKSSAGIGVEALPDTAQICSCNAVSKRELCKAVRDGAHTVSSLKDCTKAGTTCGGCVPLVTQVMNSELKKLGVEVKKDICEHFAHTRQELYHLVRVNRYRTFDEVRNRHGRGLGCDICKPAIGAILASCWNEYVLKDEHAHLQDSNDHVLANIQKDGTYSVVPRIPGGEITPDALLAIGTVAKKYDLYTKITGGQRIDLFGARLEQLPSIWEELIAAGFESGHAYGKALRTVKSCVGSSWCRYGVQDSVGMAILIENRYKGLRAPHKVKMAVSGCTRECAEAQSKDVGVIATEKGWNLYVCGNGGMKPRHAELLASDLDDVTLLRYIDRFLMFYIRTADRLQRTSTWRDNLEGGLDYLKQVVCEDSLGIGAELEAEMALVIGSYQDEWRSTVEDPAKRARFRAFVNSDAVDDNVVFVRERGQIRPAAADEKTAGATQEA